MDFINLTAENLAEEHLCCIIRSKKPHPGVEAKRQWLADRLGEGHVFRKLDAKGTVFIEYAPLETAWVPIEGENYLYLYCLWVTGAAYKGKGYGRALMEYCLNDAKERGRSGVCMLGARKQKSWLSDQAFAKKFGFTCVDTAGEYELLALSFDGTAPRFAQNAKKQRIENQELTVYFDRQCPFIEQRVRLFREYCEANAVPLSLIEVDTLQKAKAMPGVFNNWAVFYRGEFQTVNLLDTAALGRLLKK
ncbi:N-acetyltransferase [Agathobaculum sp.]|uniref:N-acetyltransferase n=1 Tax=Agathobaculum sp. TaxID=2048138 RepID=UPI002A82ED6A|nr:N-acetyltransferase [Agathobaculum sp.]MDY3617675.1 N-acetyltransferase [Agathobaculum sp.]